MGNTELDIFPTLNLEQQPTFAEKNSGKIASALSASLKLLICLGVGPVTLRVQVPNF